MDVVSLKTSVTKHRIALYSRHRNYLAHLYLEWSRGASAEGILDSYQVYPYTLHVVLSHPNCSLNDLSVFSELQKSDGPLYLR